MDEHQDKKEADSEDDQNRIPGRASSSSRDCPPRNTPSPSETGRAFSTPIALSPISGFLFSGMAGKPTWMPPTSSPILIILNSIGEAHVHINEQYTRLRIFMDTSPPQFVSLEQIMSAAKGVSDMVLCHEIAVNQDFVLQKAEPQEGRLETQVKNIVHKVFWDLLTEELKEDPPRYDQAMVLLSDVKKGLLSLLTPQHTKLAAQIEEVLDIDLIRQQAEHGALDVQHYASFVLTIMSRLCAPVRDQRIGELREVTDIVPLFKGILELTDLMHLDMANFTIQQFRPTIQQHSIEYERTKFQEYLKSQQALFPQVDALEFTKKWLQRNYNNLLSEQTNFPSSPGEKKPPSLNLTLTKAYLELVEWDVSQPFPETVVIDQARFVELGNKILLSILVGSVLLVTLSLSGPDLQFISSFKEHLKKRILLILQDHTQQLQSASVVKEQLQNVSEQLEKEVQDCLSERGLPLLSSKNCSDLKDQVLVVASPEHRVRSLVRNRVLSFLEEVISSSTASPVRVPPGLSPLQTELAGLAGQFLRLVGHNRAVFQEYYGDIVESFGQKEPSQ